MKKITVVLNFLVLALFISGCGCSKKEEEKIENYHCLHEAINDDYTYDVKYDFEADSNEKLITYKRIEKYTSDNNEVLNNMKIYKQQYFEKFNGVEGLVYSDNLSDNELNIELTIDFSKIDKEKLLEIEPFYLNFYDSDDEFNINYTIDYYIGEGMICS
ncbi:MAG: YehR family protein [Bacilli bacterium]|nr:YehR family protein [Bacilli bacterium]